MKKQGLIVLLFIFLVFPLASAYNSSGKAVIYYNEACSDCTIYIKKNLVVILRDYGITDIQLKDYINNDNYRKELVEFNKRNGIPMELQSHLTAVVNDRIILEGHVPESIIRDLLSQQEFDKVLVYQDEMKKEARTYKVWAFSGEIKEYPIRTPISEYIDWFKSEGSNRLQNSPVLSNFVSSSLLPLVIVTGLLDGINPCAFAVLLFFIAYLFTIKRARVSVIKMGVVYIAAIYLAYFLIGIGIMKALVITGQPHLMAKIGAILIIILGFINIKDYFKPELFPIHLKIPHQAVPHIKEWAYKATFPAASIMGFLVGLCTFPCSGGIYVAIIGLLSAKATYFNGIAYLLLYNLMFVMPLVVILLVTSSASRTVKLKEWRDRNARLMKLEFGVAMILIGFVILKWFV
jgi:cytochrome c biogenesis protein CcdA